MTHIWIRAEERPNEQRVAVTPSGVTKLVQAGFRVTLEEDPTRAILSKGGKYGELCSGRPWRLSSSVKLKIS